MRKPGVLLRLDRLQYACHPDVGARPAPFAVCSGMQRAGCFHVLSSIVLSSHIYTLQLPPCNFPLLLAS